MKSIKNIFPHKIRIWLGSQRIAISSYIRNIYLFHIYYPYKEKILRKKKQINVIFVLSDLGMWKTENLYLRMLKHPRFNPMLKVVDTKTTQGAYNMTISYLKKKGYEFEFVDCDIPLQHNFKADLIFYQKPYDEDYFPAHEWRRNMSSLLCYCPYYVHDTLEMAMINTEYQNLCWHNYFENESTAKEVAPLMDNKGRNIMITGLPMFDQFLRPRDSYSYKWKKQDKPKKRIIYAPHFSISNCLKRSTFLENGEFMLKMAEKYKDQIQIVFKPHPVLMKYLVAEWGQEKAEAYYRKWEQLDNGQVELGAYVDLFMTSDAMIHDCGSFATEYIFTGKPVMFLCVEHYKDLWSELTITCQKLHALHYKGLNTEDIERFIIDVINGKDSLKKERCEFFEKSLKPVNGMDSCDNIINAILNNSR